jgi:hypothetical protein
MSLILTSRETQIPDNSCEVGDLIRHRPHPNHTTSHQPLQLLMLNASPNQFILNISLRNIQFFLFSLLPLLLCTPVRAETKGNIWLAQEAPMAQVSNEQLPAPPINQDPYTVPRVNNGDGQSVEFQAQPAPSNTQPYQQPASTYQYNNQTAERFAVFVDASNYNYQVLPVVKQVEPSAFIRNFGGRSVIQAGTFSRQQNAIARIQQLVATGLNLNNVRLFNVTRGQEITLTPTNSGGNNGGNNGVNVNQNRSNYYYVAIPARSEDLPAIEDRIRGNLGQSLGNINVLRRNSPRGTHIAVGPFADRGLAEQWNAAIKNAGLGNARVYYGK